MNRLLSRFSSLDFRVGVRMLARYPGLTVVGTVAIAVAIALGTLYFEAVDKFQNPRLPIADADRVLSIHNWDVNGFFAEPRTLHDFFVWRQQARTVEDMGAASLPPKGAPSSVRSSLQNLHCAKMRRHGRSSWRWRRRNRLVRRAAHRRLWR